jgi:hypothetical protein
MSTNAANIARAQIEPSEAPGGLDCIETQPLHTSWCSACRRDLPVSEFYRLEGGTGRPRYVCKPCERAAKREARDRRRGGPPRLQLRDGLCRKCGAPALRDDRGYSRSRCAPCRALDTAEYRERVDLNARRREQYRRLREAGSSVAEAIRDRDLRAAGLTPAEAHAHR